MKVIFTTETTRKEFDTFDEATFADVMSHIGKEVLSQRCVYVNGEFINAYEWIVEDPKLMRLPINYGADPNATSCHIEATLTGWLLPPLRDGTNVYDHRTPWLAGFYGRCPHCEQINEGMVHKPTRFCPHCGKQVC